MPKKKNLTEADKFYIKEHVHVKSIEELSEETNATQKSVSEFLETLSQEEKEEIDNRTAEDKKKHWPVETHGGAAIMTEAGSRMGDEALKKKKNPVDSKYGGYHKPLG